MKRAFAAAAASTALCVLAGASAAHAATEMLSHTQTTLDTEVIGSIPDAGGPTSEPFEITITNMTGVTWTDYVISIFSSDEVTGEFINIKSITVPAGPFEAGARIRSPDPPFFFNKVRYSDGSLASGDSFTANLTVQYEHSITLRGTPSTETGGAPEPGVWIMLVAGFGLVGSRLRSARTPPPLIPAKAGT